jgi:hypothetical protein
MKLKQAPVSDSGAEDQEEKNEEKQEVNAALQNVCPAAGESHDACPKSQEEEGKVSTFYA